MISNPIPKNCTTWRVKEEHHDLLAGFRKMLIAELRRTDAGMVDNLPPVKVVTKETK
jgi:hypothetical protein